MAGVITAREATIKTATVEIKTLTVSGKQVTMGVFRQLENQALIDGKTGELIGVPWGRVNYYWGDCAPNHLHIVWQHADQLKRACVYRDGRSPVAREERDTRESISLDMSVYVRAIVSKHLLDGTRWSTVEKGANHLWFPLPEVVWGDGYLRHCIRFEPNSYTVDWHYWGEGFLRLTRKNDPKVAERKSRGEYIDKRWQQRDETDIEYDERINEEEQVARKYVVEYLRKALPDGDLAWESQNVHGWRAELVKLGLAYTASHDATALADKRWADNYAALEALDQLFIAV